MADDETPEEEPSIEEILDSIRQIISDDDEEEAPAEAPTEDDAPAEPEEAVAPEEDVVELTDKVDEPEAAPEPEPKPEPKPKPEPEPAPESEPEPEPESVELEMRDFDEDDEDSVGDEGGDILTGVAEAAAYEGFEELVKKTAVEHNGITLEEIVRTELKPLLRDWLDNNLPSMIERLVEEELRRVSKQVLGSD